MEITWYGLSCFRLTERGLATVVTDPYDHRVAGYEALKLKADIVTISHNAPGHNYESGVKGKSRVITGPCEFEIGRAPGAPSPGRSKPLKPRVARFAIMTRHLAVKPQSLRQAIGILGHGAASGDSSCRYSASRSANSAS